MKPQQSKTLSTDTWHPGPFPERNLTDQDYPDGCVHELFERRAGRTPDAVALTQGRRRITYQELNDSANRVANGLQRRGVGHETLVGVAVEQSLDAIVAILGVLKAGAAYVPLDPAWPQSRFTGIVQETGTPIVLARAGLAQEVPARVSLLPFDNGLTAFANESSTTPVSTCDLDSAAYVLYTSGSTGRPKGVVGIHRSIVNGLLSVTYAGDERCCLNTSLTFGFSVANLFLPLMAGVPLAVLSMAEIKDIPEFARCLEREAITRVVLVVPVFRQLLELSEAPARLKTVRSIGLAGAAITPDLVHRCAEVVPHAKLHASYSSSEIGTLATIWDVTPEAVTRGDIVIGHPVANTRMYILDDQWRHTPVGEVGEIYVAARHLARGYLNEPELTAQRFIEVSHNGNYERLLKTGDLGRFRPDGEIEFIGRADEQVKIRGFRIELLEVERALTSHMGLRGVAIAAREISGELRLIAYVVVKAPDAPTVRELRKFLSERLPEFMIPSAFVFLDQLPLNENGKVDRSALPQPEATRPMLDSPYEAPRNAIESKLAKMWSAQLDFEEIGIHDDFLELGGDSLLAVQLVDQIALEYGCDVPLETLFDRPTIAMLADYISQQTKVDRPKQAV